MSSFRKLHRWAIEVDQNQQHPNLAPQRQFIRDFGREIYQAVDSPASLLRDLRHVYFTRIFDPETDHIGAYVRLHFCL